MISVNGLAPDGATNEGEPVSAAPQPKAALEPTAPAPLQAASLQPAPRQPASLQAVYRQHQAFVWRSVRRLGVPDEAVDDAVQDVFLVVADHLADFEGRAAITTWLFAIALRVARYHRRKAGRRARLADALAKRTSGSAVPAAEDPVEDADLLRHLLDQLDEHKRAVFILAELEHFSAPQIAEVLGCNPNTVYTRLRAARMELDKAVSRYRALERRRTT